ncbi:Anti-sigma regulatory factor (Ser/Thr protein kinase) [Micromonospora viridifaciens]|uniref:Anti-sigma regulatory factor (Ser/Thr protein kinase) n=1 Tax=Micromonospora viridifaciens TaxID=1881 RepID=A0A1C4XL13_MICVI|nr:ATP-binding protein [Micromonospora viridifaciens]SCF09124.1 Anti-sigma regulatory factor (Ser/Thr protein kinase) [Micromonospora viridifaciens]
MEDGTTTTEPLAGGEPAGTAPWTAAGPVGPGPAVPCVTSTRAHPAGTVFTAAVPADPGLLAPTRERLRGWLHALGVDEWDVETVLIATGEACANAIEHGYGFAVGGITTLRAELRDDLLEIEVRDHGGWREVPATPGTDRGRGRLIMARVMDEATIVGTPDGTTVRLVKRLSGGR